MNIFLFILLGAIAGWLASLLMGSNASQGIVGDIAVGVVGAVIGGFMFSLIGAGGVTGLNLYSLIVAVIGSMLFIWLYRTITSRS